MSAPLKFFVLMVFWWSDRLNTVILSELPPDVADRLWIDTSQTWTTVWSDWSCCRNIKGQKGICVELVFGAEQLGPRGSLSNLMNRFHRGSARWAAHWCCFWESCFSFMLVADSTNKSSQTNKLVKAGLSGWSLLFIDPRNKTWRPTTLSTLTSTSLV